ncbi:MAG: sugar phosphate isomerase/epimerase [bacterium]
MLENFGDSAFSHAADIVTAGVKNIELTWSIGLPLDDKKMLLDRSGEILKTGVKIISMHTPLRDGNGKDLDISAADNWDRKFAIREIQKSMIAFRLAAPEHGEKTVIHCGRKCDYTGRKSRLEKSIESLKEILDFNRDFGYEICLENTLPGDVGCFLEDLLLVKEKLNSEKIKFCFDTGHYNIGRKQDDILTEMTRDISEMHIHDNNGKNDEHFAPGDGNIVWKDLFSKISGWSGTPVFELMESAPYGIEKCIKFARESGLLPAEPLE